MGDIAVIRRMLVSNMSYGCVRKDHYSEQSAAVYISGVEIKFYF